MSFGARQPGCSRTGGPEGCSPRESSVTLAWDGASAERATGARASAVVAHRATRQAHGSPEARGFTIMFFFPKRRLRGAAGNS